MPPSFCPAFLTRTESTGVCRRLAPGIAQFHAGSPPQRSCARATEPHKCVQVHVDRLPGSSQARCIRIHKFQLVPLRARLATRRSKLSIPRSQTASTSRGSALIFLNNDVITSHDGASRRKLSGTSVTARRCKSCSIFMPAADAILYERAPPELPLVDRRMSSNIPPESHPQAELARSAGQTARPRDVRGPISFTHAASPAAMSSAAKAASRPLEPEHCRGNGSHSRPCQSKAGRNLLEPHHALVKGGSILKE